MHHQAAGRPPKRRLANDQTFADELDFCDRTGTPHSLLLGRLPTEGEPLWLPEDRAKLHALWAWRREHCSSCHHRRADGLDEDGVELKDLPFEVRDVYCPFCALLEDHQDEAPKGAQRRHGTHPYIARLEDPEEPTASGSDRP